MHTSVTSKILVSLLNQVLSSYWVKSVLWWQRVKTTTLLAAPGWRVLLLCVVCREQGNSRNSPTSGGSGGILGHLKAHSRTHPSEELQFDGLQATTEATNFVCLKIFFDFYILFVCAYYLLFFVFVPFPGAVSGSSSVPSDSTGRAWQAEDAKGRSNSLRTPRK